MTAAAFLERAARAEQLSAQDGAAAEPLRFAASLYRAQAAAAEKLEGAADSSESADQILAAARTVWAAVASHGPALLREAALERSAEGDDVALERLQLFWNGGAEQRQDFLSRIALRPWAQSHSRQPDAPANGESPGHCPRCGGEPWVACRVADASTDGARRLLDCGLCGHRWQVPRILCPSCGENDPTRLPVFSSERYPTVRLEACSGCRRYLKSLDLTVDARAIPEVDELLSLSLDLWAREQRFTRVERGLAGL